MVTFIDPALATLSFLYFFEMQMRLFRRLNSLPSEVCPCPSVPKLLVL